MVRLEFARRHGKGKRKDGSARKLARLSLSADDEMIGEVRARVDRADWFNRAPAEPEPRTDEPARPRPQPSVPQARAAREKVLRVRGRKLARRVHRPSGIVLLPPAPDGIEVLQTKADRV